MFTLSEFDEHRSFGHVNIYRVGTTVYEILGALPIITPHQTIEAARHKFKEAVLEAQSDMNQQIAIKVDSMDPTTLQKRLDYLDRLIK